jgi:hypothetical protein
VRHSGIALPPLLHADVLRCDSAFAAAFHATLLCYLYARFMTTCTVSLPCHNFRSFLDTIEAAQDPLPAWMK